MLLLPLPLQSTEIHLAAMGKRAGNSLATLARLMQLPIRCEEKFAGVDACLADNLSLFPTEAKGFRLTARHNLPPWISGEWSRMLRFASFSAARRNGNIFLMHGCLFDGNADKNNGTLLFADSGAGKSTAAVRYRALGGSCRGDDMILCEIHEGQLIAYPLPTLSYYSQHWSSHLRYPFLPGIRIHRLLLLQRTCENERIITVDRKEWMARLAHSVSFHWCQYTCPLSDSMLQWASNRVLDTVLELAERFSSMALETRWGDNIRSALEETQC